MPTTLLTRLLSRTLFILALVAPGVLMAAVPSQFIAKQFSEALGRAPDNGSWQYYTNHFLTNGCSTGSLQAVLNGFFSSAEYTGKGYTPQEMILTGYRAVLSREPDPSGFSYWVSRFNAGATASQMVFELSNSAEFADLLGAICAGDAYRQDWGLSQAMDIGSGTWTQAQLEACINSNVVCSVPPRTIIYLSSTLTIPAGKVLETSGNPDRLQYARQARIVRNSGSFVNLLRVQAGAKVRNIWLSGQRHLYKSAPTNIDEVRANIWYEGVGGGGGLVQGIRSDFPLVRSHIVSVGPGGSLDINNNLLTGYTSNHTSDGTESWITDGISQHAATA
ncbi:MAG: DUF4214 domain-containing protein [Ramlibacter sp.]|nr:DUF4214 domain-containing protein [Ramlibacter sp.]